MLRRDDDCSVKGLRPRFDMLYRIFVNALVQNADLVDPVHDAADLRDRLPSQSVVQGRRIKQSPQVAVSGSDYPNRL